MTTTASPSILIPEPQEITRYGLFERVVHWEVAITFVALMLSGIALAYPCVAWLSGLFGGGQTMRAAHPWIGVAFTVGVLAMLVMWARHMRFQRGDGEWVRRLPHYTREGHAGLDVGRFNAGQKGYYWMVIILSLILLLSGIPLWYPWMLSSGWNQWSRLVHHAAYLLMVAGFIIHVYMSTALLPGTMSAMTTGKVSRRWAAWHHPRLVPRAGRQRAVIQRPRGGPGQFDARLARAEHLLAADSSATAPLATLVAVLHHQRRRATAPEVAAEVDRLVPDGVARRSAGTFPHLNLDDSFAAVAAEVTRAVREIDGEHLPAALRDSGGDLTSTTSDERAEQIATWFDDPDVVAPLAAFWFRIAAGVVVELAAALVGAPTSDTWQGMSCPLCGASAQVSVIAEESGEFMGGSPRNLVCSRCATWWSFPRVCCPYCGQADPRSIYGFRVSENPVVRVDCCETCHGYVKTFDLRQAAARDVVPIVDDVATLSLDLWVQARGFQRASMSFAGA